MDLEPRHIIALDTAETLMFHKDFCPYLELNELLADSSPQARNRFRTLFTNYYGLNLGGLTDAFKKRYFDILFGGNVILNGQPDFSTILNELSLIPRRKGDFAMHFSFVSKLVAMHKETSPIFDERVREFFKEKVPDSKVPKPKRIAWFVGFLKQVAANYVAWSQDKRVAPILIRLKARDPRLAQCHDIRLLDFLVWKVGNQKLLVKP